MHWCVERYKRLLQYKKKIEGTFLKNLIYKNPFMLRLINQYSNTHLVWTLLAIKDPDWFIGVEKKSLFRLF